MKKIDKKKKAGRIGSSLDDFLKEDGIYEGVTARAIKRVLVRQLGELMRREEITKTELAARMKTSCAQLDRLLDPENEFVTLEPWLGRAGGRPEFAHGIDLKAGMALALLTASPARCRRGLLDLLPVPAAKPRNRPCSPLR